MSQATRTCIALSLQMAVLHPRMEGGGNGLVLDSRQGRPFLKLGVPLSTWPFNTACYNLTKSQEFGRFFGTDTAVGLGWAQQNGTWCRCGRHAWVDLRIPAVTDNSFIQACITATFPPYIPHVIIQDLCCIYFSSLHLLTLANLKCSHTDCYDGQYKQVSYECT
jgi:hypothetical protein